MNKGTKLRLVNDLLRAESDFSPEARMIAVISKFAADLANFVFFFGGHVAENNNLEGL